MGLSIRSLSPTKRRSEPWKPTQPSTSPPRAWEGFIPGNWTENIDVRDFIQKNYTPYEGDASFLAGPTDKTLRVWNTLESTYLSEERKRRIYDVDTKIPADIDAFPAGYISEDDDVIVACSRRPLSAP